MAQTTEEREKEFQQIIDQVKAEHPGVAIKRIILPGREDELFLVRIGTWAEFKSLMAAGDKLAEMYENLIQKFLVYPKPNYAAINAEWLPGHVMKLGEAIGEALGVTAKSAEIKKA